MSERVAQAVLAKASALDPTMPTPNPVTALAWAEQMTGVAMTEALEAVRLHYASSAERLMPAHIWRHVKELRRVELELEHARTLRESAALRRGLPTGSDPYDGAHNSNELEELHQAVNSSGRCPECGEDERCRSNGVSTKIPHYLRIKQAKRAGVSF